MKRVVVAIPASYNAEQELETDSTIRYLKYLEKNATKTVMTTAGTSHYNLLTIDEIHELNSSVALSFKGHKILGVPAVNQRQAVEFVTKAKQYADENTNFMLLYPERFYSEEKVVDYMQSIAQNCDNQIYIHGKTIRNATGGSWDYTSDVINTLHQQGVLKGIKEEHSQLNKSYDFVSKIHDEVDVIVAGGSMRRYEFLRSAGANAFLSGVGNLFPDVEQRYINGDIDLPLELEKKMFDIFMKYGWHKSLRIALDYLDLTCYNNREPWPETLESEREEIIRVVEEIRSEK